MKIRNKKGFTLMEILAVVLIVVILATIALPVYNRIVLKSRASEVNNLLTMVRTRQAIKFAKDKEYASTFEDKELRKIAMGPSDYEVNSGKFKTINNDYELELVNEETPNPDGSKTYKNCVKGSYKPDGAAGAPKFTFAIAYNKNGLACEDGAGLGWSVCNSFGSAVVSNSIDDVCAGTDPNQTTCERKPCGNCQYFDPNFCDCVYYPEERYSIGPNEVFDSNEESCKRCVYGCGSDQSSVNKVTDNSTHTISATPSTIDDNTFDCLDQSLALGGDPIGCAEYDETGTYAPGETQACLKPIYECHSAVLKEWSCEACKWICPISSDPGICNGDQIWNSTLCMCTCKPGSRCLCHETQYFSKGTCLCISDEAVKINDTDRGCVCAERAQFGEAQDDRQLNSDNTHCQCRSGRTAVFFGTVTGRPTAENSGSNEYKVNIANAESLAAADPFPYWQAACCLDSHLWYASELPDFNYDACCPYTDYKVEGQDPVNTHIQFNGNTKQCCSGDALFYNSASQNQAVTDPNYSGRSAGSFPAKTCHKCENWYQAYDDSFGCYSCPTTSFATFTTWDDGLGASKCSCPDGTHGSISFTGGQATHNCQCNKHNATWDPGINYVKYTGNNGLGFVGEGVWHQHNGACQCNTGYEDTYYGYQLGLNASSPVISSDGFCCPSDLAKPVYAGSTLKEEKACCPSATAADPEVALNYFHATSFAHNSCGVCQNERDTYVNGNCQPCPDGMYPIFDSTLGYSKCACPQGTHYTQGNEPVATSELICQCDLGSNASWQAPSNWVDEYLSHINNLNNMPSPWNSYNGYCSCDPNFEFADHGLVNGTYITSSGYCCPTTTDNPLGYWRQSHDNPQQSFCCNTSAAFNSEAGYAACCESPAENYYYTLDQLPAILKTGGRLTDNPNDGVGVAVVGGCSRCEYPDANGLDNCNPCPAPKIPVWNNSRTDGYSECMCPKGMTEIQETPQTFWSSLISGIKNLFSSYEEDINNMVMGDCKCIVPNAIVVLENGEYKCICPGDGVMVNNGQNCCPPGPDGNAYWYNNQCQLCPQETPYYYESSNTCNACEENMYAYQVNDNTICCPNPVDQTAFAATGNIYQFEQGCSVCNTNQLYDPQTHACVNLPTNTPCVWTINSQGIPLCQCTDGYEFNISADQCTCISDNYTGEQCACEKCQLSSHPVSSGSGSNEQFGWRNYPPPAQCACTGQHRQFVAACCEDSTIHCCQCTGGYVETTLGDSSVMDYGCCAPEDIAANTRNQPQKACCDGGIHFNTADSVCCPATQPIYATKTNGTKICSACPNPDGQYYNTTSGACSSCAEPKELGGWDNTYNAYTSCVCPAGTSETGLGGSISSTSNECKCPLEGSTWNGEKCVCSSGNSIYAGDNVTLVSCCPSNRYHDGQCCEEGTTWTGTYCSVCPETQIFKNGQCQNCPALQEPVDWDEDLHAYTDCDCYVGSKITTGNSTGNVRVVGGDSRGSNGSTPTQSCTPPEAIYYMSNGSEVASQCYCDSCTHYTDGNFAHTTYSSGTTSNKNSCKQCPAGSVWDSTKKRCGCSSSATSRGFTTQNGKCVCNAAHAFSKINLGSCDDPNDSNCICGACPTGTTWCSNANSCKCNLTHNDYGIYSISNGDAAHTQASMHVYFNSSLPNSLNGFYNTIDYGYCIYYCDGPGSYELSQQGKEYVYSCPLCSTGTCLSGISASDPCGARH